MRGALIAFVAGVVLLQQQARLPGFAALAAATALALGLYYLAARRGRAKWLARCGAAAVFGFVWASLFAHVYLAQELPAVWEGRDLWVTGTVDSLPFNFEQGVRFNFAVESVAVEQGAQPVLPSRLALSWYGTPSATPVPALQPGERWRLNVRLKRPHGNANPDGFDYEVWLLEQGLRATGTVRPERAQQPNQRLDALVWSVANLVERARAALRERIHAALPGQAYAGVLVALVVGDQREVAQSDWQVFNRTGVGHLFSISGLHITMLAGLCAALVFYLWRHSFFLGATLEQPLPLRVPAHKAAALAGLATALLYVALSGFGVPAQRTLYMIGVVTVALWSNRLASVSQVLCWALGLVVVLDPWAVLWPGFWLSFGAVAIILFASTGRIEQAVPVQRRERLRRAWHAAVRTQYVVTLGLVPLTLLLFGQLSLVSPFANAVAIPLVSFVVTPLALLGSVLPLPLAAGVLGAAHACVAWLAQVLAFFSSQPFAVWAAPLPAFWMFALALAGALWLLLPRGWPLRWLGLPCFLPALLSVTEQPRAGEFAVTALDVGQGMALLVETAQHRLLYDSGPAYSPESDGGSRVILPYLAARGIGQLDALIVSHNDSDHSGGAQSVLRGLPVARLLSSLKGDSTIVLAAPQHQPCLAGQRWQWDGVSFEILQPGAPAYDSPKWKPNALSCVLKVSDGRHAMLLPGDIEAVQEDELLHTIPEKLRADVLLAPHHGSGTSSTAPFLQAVRPELALFQVGYLNRYHHPKDEVWQRYADFGVKRLRTDQAGAITLQFGASLQFSEFRQTHARYWYGR